ncbi:alpha/beta hydrolase [Sphaerimonospora cavernae]|uniref:Alpha/beta hydrolase n=1 Tax=Sphaerimonospora cavernae TaxID=1740611 RepID=A0ABV6U2C2_9ACTN
MGGDGVRCADLDIDAGTHFIPIRIFQPEAGSGGLRVWAHGGSWITGSLDQWHGATTEFACVSDWTVISVGYRLAPQHRHPAQFDDVLAALAWAEANDVDDLPPAIIAVGELDPVIDDVTAYARALHEAGNDVTLQVFPDTFHAAFLSPYSDMRRWLGNALHDHISHQSSPQ